MKILSSLPFYYKIVGIITIAIGVLLLFSVFGSHVFGLKTIDMGVAFILISFLLFVLSKEKEDDTKTKKMQALVLAIVINTTLLTITCIVVASSNKIFAGIVPLYVNTFSVFLIYFVLYYIILPKNRTNKTSM